MLGDELVDEAVPLLATAIGMIMEDHVDAAVTTKDPGARSTDRAGRLAEAGNDIATLAEALSVLLRRRGERAASAPASP